MKTIKIFNLIAIITPLTIAIAGIFNQDFLIWALLSTMFTGGLQVLIALALLTRFYANIKLWIYLFGVVFFFVFFAIFESNTLIILPPMLCIYLTFIIYKINP
jgi:hypothetical protein